MGHYTELKFKAKLKSDTPEYVINILKRILIERDLGNITELFKTEDVFKPNIEHDFFKCERWYMLFLSNNFDTTKLGGRFYKEKERWVIKLDTEFKNYDNEIEYFFDWIKPFIIGRKKKEYVGFWRSETMDSQINLYVER